MVGPMNARVPRLILLLTALGFLGFGAAFTLWPLPLARVIEIPLPTATARIDFAATYGGFELGFGAFLLACLRKPEWLQAGLWASAAALTGFAAVRLQSILFASGVPLQRIYAFLALELFGAALAWWAARRAGPTA
jgi:hypothetical protein